VAVTNEETKINGNQYLPFEDLVAKLDHCKKHRLVNSSGFIQNFQRGKPFRSHVIRRDLCWAIT